VLNARLKVLIMVTVLGATLAVPAASNGRTSAAFDSKVTLKTDNPFHGRVISDKAACRKGRTVQVFNVQPGADGMFGATETDAQGKWSMPASPNGDFYAKVTRKVGPVGTSYSCRPDKSPVRTF
jgi:hypothetical protein